VARIKGVEGNPSRIRVVRPVSLVPNEAPWRVGVDATRLCENRLLEGGGLISSFEKTDRPSE
jgi:hypothetical protein